MKLKHKEVKRIYLSGPMVGYTQMNSVAFNREARYLRDNGYEVSNPVELTDALKKELGRRPSRQECLKLDFHELTKCDAIYMLNGWSHSPGANKERQVALDCGLQIFYEEEQIE